MKDYMFYKEVLHNRQGLWKWEEQVNNLNFTQVNESIVSGNYRTLQSFDQTIYPLKDQQFVAMDFS